MPRAIYWACQKI